MFGFRALDAADTVCVIAGAYAGVAECSYDE
jgi:hypothetical protein